MENPYASPQCGDNCRSADDLLRATTRMYRGIGRGGIAYCTLAYLIAIAATPMQRMPGLAGAIGSMVIYALMLAFFVFVLETTDRLEVEFDRTYRRARWLGILAAAIFFPVLTWPGVLAMRRLEKYGKLASTEMPAES